MYNLIYMCRCIIHEAYVFSPVEWPNYVGQEGRKKPIILLPPSIQSFLSNARLLGTLVLKVNFVETLS